LHKRREVIGYRNLHNEEHYNLRCLPDIIVVTVKKGDKHRAGMGEMRNVYKNVVRKPEGREPLERSKHR
jgi:hypothetical protein